MNEPRAIPPRAVSPLAPWLLEVLAAPGTGARLAEIDGSLVSADGTTFAISPVGIPMFAVSALSEQGAIQQAHYDRIASAYIKNLGYPHTQEYMAYLDRVLLEAVPQGSLGVVAELCCGGSEAIQLLGDRMTVGLGVDVSARMLEAARAEHPDSRFGFVQGDATMLPLCDACVDTVVMLGGVHHVPDRRALFSEIHRILKPNGVFIWREPASDFFLWRWLRAVIYRVSPMLDASTERPLLYEETVPYLHRAGLQLAEWRTFGFAGFCLFMNSDVLVVTRLLRFIPGIRTITRLATRFDHALSRIPALGRAGLQVVGVARKTSGSGS
jgi:ubiquinone/menaquinone biosynthesis C-methylase UbiE